MAEGQVFVASMNMRGARAELPPLANLQIVNATSCQALSGIAGKNRFAFSPMHHHAGGYTGFDGVVYHNFEAFWQSGKVYEDIPEETTKHFWRNVYEPKRRYPGSQGKRVLYARWDGLDAKLDWVDSRKQVYVPLYDKYISDTEMLGYWRDQVKQGVNVVVYDFDGPRYNIPGPHPRTDELACLPVTGEMLTEKLNDTNFPFGHGYVLAAAIAGLNFGDWCY